MHLKNKMLLAFVFVLSINGSVYSEESETSCSDMMLKRIFAIKSDIERQYSGMWIKPDKKCYFEALYAKKSSQGHEWIIGQSSCEEGICTFFLLEFPYLESPVLVQLQYEVVKSRTNEGEMLSEKVHVQVHGQVVKIDNRMKCKKRKNGCLKCLLILPIDEFEEKYKKFVEEQKEAKSAVARKVEE